ncbi:outer membrane protein assembly factor BamB family protein [Frankia gtarii]|uniref:outer membrane protein assembly factor BamB family protein n=1 Tax=Frankia gtarii TaxID=2950102 RepID=UPI0021BF531C|nr:PQQ-binding-like beta-propeller repeat protein [Frankia gtarii]
MQGKVLGARGEPVPNVMISDGQTITRTGTDGMFSLTPTGPFVFLTRPAGFTATPWFVPATTTDVTFTLTPGETADSGVYRFVHVSDLHVSVDNGTKFYPPGSEIGSQDALSLFLRGLPERAAEVQSVIATGDLTDLGSDAEFDALRRAVDTSILPVHVLPGNHDHMAGGGEVGFVVSRNNYAINTGEPSGYERNLGPRWFSFDLPGLHVVALDWHTHELGLDDAAQDAWLRADLEEIGPNTPWILLSHDQPWTSILDGLPSDPVATFSGHRHTSRVIRLGRTIHVNTPTPLFAGLDYSPPSYRIVRWDGEQLGLETRAVARTGLERATFAMPAAIRLRAAEGDAAEGDAAEGDAAEGDAVVRWRHQLSGAGHRAPVRVEGDRVIAGAKREDLPSGAVEVLSLRDGSQLWQAELRASIKGTPVTHHGHVIAVEVSGDVVSLDAETGAERWRIPSPDPLRLFAWADPVIADGILIVGDLSHVRALDADTGELRWERTDLCSYQTLVSHSNPLALGATIILCNFPSPIGIAGLDLHTGEVTWQLGGDLTDLIGSLWPIGTPLHDQASDMLCVPTPSGLSAIDARTGAGRWKLTAELPFSPATPASVPDGIATVFAGTDVVLLDRADGSVRWRTPMESASELAMASYTRTPQVLFAGPVPVPVEDGSVRLLVSGLDGRIYTLDAASGKRLAEVNVGAPVAAPVAVTDELIIAIAVDGVVTAIERSALI